MKFKNYLQCMNNFNHRVLIEGFENTENDTIYSLKNYLFYCNVFISNSDELFYHKGSDGIRELYYDTLSYMNIILDNMVQSVNTNIHDYILSDEAASLEIIKDAFDNYEFNINDNEDIDIDYIGKSVSDTFIVVIYEFSYHFIEIPYDFIESGIMNISDDITTIYNFSKSLMKGFSILMETNDVIYMRMTKDRSKIFKCEYSSFNGERYDEFIHDIGIEYSRAFYNTSSIYQLNQLFNNIKLPELMHPGSKSITKVITRNLIMHSDMMLEYPMDSFDSYINFMKLTSNDNNVAAISIFLYRIGNNNEIFDILSNAVRNGILVQANIELHASGEYVNNMWVKKFQNAGIRVSTYMASEVKVHSKATLIEYNDGRMICQIGTGNYHVGTAKNYCDLSLFTSDYNICKNVKTLFDAVIKNITNASFDSDLLVSRYNARNHLYRLIKSQSHRNGYIAIKCNSLSDNDMIMALENAAMNGCKIDLCIRGVCTWIPQYDHVMVKSAIWGKLEHARIYCFGKCNPVTYMGSLDLVTSKLDYRIESLVRVKNCNSMMQIIDYINSYISNVDKSWVMNKSGEYEKGDVVIV